MNTKLFKVPIDIEPEDEIYCEIKTIIRKNGRADLKWTPIKIIRPLWKNDKYKEF